MGILIITSLLLQENGLFPPSAETEWERMTCTLKSMLSFLSMVADDIALQTVAKDLIQQWHCISK